MTCWPLATAFGFCGAVYARRTRSIDLSDLATFGSTKAIFFCISPPMYTKIYFGNKPTLDSDSENGPAPYVWHSKAETRSKCKPDQLALTCTVPHPDRKSRYRSRVNASFKWCLYLHKTIHVYLISLIASPNPIISFNKGVFRVKRFKSLPLYERRPH